MLLATGLVTAGAVAGLPSRALAAAAGVGGVGPVGLVSKSADLLDAFVVGNDGFVYTASWKPGDPAFSSFSRIGNLRVAPCSPVTPVSRRDGELDIFVAGLDGRVYWSRLRHAALGGTFWDQWRTVSNLVTTPHATITAVSRSLDKVDVFAVGIDGFVYTAAWQPSDGSDGFRGWWRVGDAQTTPGSQVSVVSRSADKMDVFMVGLDGKVLTAAWQPGWTEFHGWWQVAGGISATGAPVGAVCRTADRLDVFAIGTDGKVYTAAWQAGWASWQGWSPVGDLAVPKRACVTAVSRSENKIDVFTTGTDGRIWTAAWQPGWASYHGWWSVASGGTQPGTAIGAVSRSQDKLDVLVAGHDAKVYAAAWQPGWSEFHGWWAVGHHLTTGMTDPGVGSWTKTGVAFSSENTAWSEEAQGMATGGVAWYLVSNGEKTLRKRLNGSWVGSVSIPWGVAGGHVGAPGVYDGWVYVPVQGPHGVWKIRTDLTSPQWFPINNNGQDMLPWCAVNPLNGRLYTSLYPTPTSLMAFDRLTLQRRPEDDIALKPGPLHLDKVQGAVFTPNGRVILVRWSFNAVFCFSALTGHCFGAKEISGMSEFESVAVRDWTYGNGAKASVHILELDNDWPSGDDCYLHGFSVPQPGLL